MLEDKISASVKSFTRSATPYLVAATLAFGISGCCGGGDECEHDADCQEGEYCGQSCETAENCSPRGLDCLPICHNICYSLENNSGR